MNKFHPDILACYLYVITKYGYPPQARNSLSHLEEFMNLGFSSIELEGIRKDHLMEMYSLRKEIKSGADKYKLKIPVFCIVLPGLSSPDPKERETNLQLFEKGCEIARDLGSKAVLDNSPLPPWKFPEGIPVARHYDENILAAASIPRNLNWTVYWNDLVGTYRQACEIAGKRNLSFHLHPCLGALVDSTDSFLLFANDVKMDNLKFNLDTANQFFLKDNLYLSLIRLQDHIEYIHMSDNRGGKVEHLETGKGLINWGRFFETLDRIDYKGQFGIDVGGAESEIDDLDTAYKKSASWLELNWFKHKSL